MTHGSVCFFFSVVSLSKWKVNRLTEFQLEVYVRGEFISTATITVTANETQTIAYNNHREFVQHK